MRLSRSRSLGDYIRSRRQGRVAWGAERTVRASLINGRVANIVRGDLTDDVLSQYSWQLQKPFTYSNVGMHHTALLHEFRSGQVTSC